MSQDVMTYDWIIPAPRGTLAKGREVIGLMRCFRGCGHFQVVRRDKNGNVYSACDSIIAVHRCQCNQLNWGKVEILDAPIIEHVLNHPDIEDLPPIYLQWLSDQWGVSVAELKGENIERPSPTHEQFDEPGKSGNPEDIQPGNSEQSKRYCDIATTGEQSEHSGNPEQPGHDGSTGPDNDLVKPERSDDVFEQYERMYGS